MARIWRRGRRCEWELLGLCLVLHWRRQLNAALPRLRLAPPFLCCSLLLQALLRQHAREARDDARPGQGRALQVQTDAQGWAGRKGWRRWQRRAGAGAPRRRRLHRPWLGTARPRLRRQGLGKVQLVQDALGEAMGVRGTCVSKASTDLRLSPHLETNHRRATLRGRAGAQWS